MAIEINTQQVIQVIGGIGDIVDVPSLTIRLSNSLDVPPEEIHGRGILNAIEALSSKESDIQLKWKIVDLREKCEKLGIDPGNYVDNQADLFTEIIQREDALALEGKAISGWIRIR